MSIKIMTLLLLFFIAVPGKCNNVEVIEKLLPVGDICLVTYTYLPSGFDNDITLVKTSLGTEYIFRQAKKLDSKDRFNKALMVAQKAAELEIAPPLYSFNASDQQILMKYVENVAWPSYDVNKQPYKDTMRMLREFHDALRPAALKGNPQFFAPFSSILNKKERLLHDSTMPKQLKDAFDIIERYQEKTALWLKKNATLYHGDFKQKNVLLEKEKNQLRPWLIDFDCTGVGHPYFDVVKFSQKMSSHQRLLLFREYLGRLPTEEEKAHFTMLDNALRMLIAIIRFEIVLKVQSFSKHATLLSKKEMEQLLESKSPLPLQSTILLSDPDPKQQQLAAVYALHDFLMHS